jgi:mono/diheme cytochrome c family protein
MRRARHALLAGFLLLAICGCERKAGAPPGKAVAPRTAVPTAGIPSRGAEIQDAVLDHALPPPPRDAVFYSVRHPLRNGRTVPLKKRWIWIPDGQKMRVARSQSGMLRVHLPVGAKLWKEFYLKTCAGEPALVERRLLLKVADRDEENGWLLNGGWKFYAAHYLPQMADGISGFNNRLRVRCADKDEQRYLFRFAQWLPTQRKAAATFVDFVDDAGAHYPYVFPGKTNCMVCHDGAAGAYADAARLPVLAFGAHPENVDPGSLQRMVDRGWIDAPAPLVAELLEQARRAVARDRMQPAVGTGRMLALFRNNCLSCHNSARGAGARQTAFVLQPGRRYSDAELARLLSASSRVMGAMAQPVIVPGQPDASELLMRLRGVQGRRRMPPAEGGVPELDRELITLTRAWIGDMPALD